MRIILDMLHEKYLSMKSCVNEKMRWRNHVPVRGSPRIYYGFDHVPTVGEKAHGGIIKAQDLQSVYPNSTEGANVLYLISSYQPAGMQYMARYASGQGVKVIVNQNGVAYPAWCGDRWKIENIPMAETVSLADYVFYQSEYCRRTAELFLGAKPKRSEILHNAVDTSFFAPVSLAVDHPRILVAGSHTQFYRVRCALDAMQVILKKYPNAHMSIAGRYRWRNTEQEALAEAEQYAKQLGISGNVEFYGAYTQAEARELFSGHSILLHPTYNDACPRLVIEAMSSGLPVVYSASGGVPELVGNAGIGLKAPEDWEMIHPPNAEDLAEAVLTVTVDLKKYSAIARTRAVEMFDVKDWIGRHKAIFEEFAS